LRDRPDEPKFRDQNGSQTGNITDDFKPITTKALEDVAYVAWNLTPNYVVLYKSTRPIINPDHYEDDLMNMQFVGGLHGLECIENTLYFAISDKANDKIFFVKSVDGGVSWLTRQIINPTYGEMGDLAAAGDRVYIAWSAWPPHGQGRIFIRRSTDGGITFPSNPSTEHMSDGSGHQYNPKIGFMGDNVFAIWSGNQSGIGDPHEYVVFARSIDGGNTFTSMQRIGGSHWGASIRLVSQLRPQDVLL
jgi:hypothetical protein